jgi:hypothetical protein
MFIFSVTVRTEARAPVRSTDWFGQINVQTKPNAPKSQCAQISAGSRLLRVRSIRRQLNTTRLSERCRIENRTARGNLTDKKPGKTAAHRFGRTTRMSYRRRQTPDASFADKLSKTQRLAAVSSIRFVRLRNHTLNLDPSKKWPSTKALITLIRRVRVPANPEHAEDASTQQLQAR